MQLQLALDVADRLHQALLVRGEPLETTEAARLLLATEHADSWCVDILGILVNEDNRFLWAETGGARLALRSWDCPDPELSKVPFVVLDLETTGARPGPGKITEVGAVRIEGLRPVKHFQTLVNPLRPIPAMITRITGIAEDMVADAPRIEEVIPQLLDFLEGAVVVAHNAPFDVGFLNYELRRLQGRRLDDGFVDTLPLARALAPGLPNYRLGTVAEALGAPVAACHRALEDALATAHVFLELATRLQERGATRLSQLRQHAGPSAGDRLHKLALTRDLPGGPGTFSFVGSTGQILLVGHADVLGEEVRSYFLSRHRSGKIRTAVRLVQRIDWQAVQTPLEALMQEHRLRLEHRPPYNPHDAKPEDYVYVRTSGAGPGLNLLATKRAPRWTVRPEGGGSYLERGLVMGPFRRSSAAHAALRLLRDCYPIRCCPRRRKNTPCTRGRRGMCMSPCVAHPARIREHDLLVMNIMRWLAGHSEPDLPNPPSRAEEVAWELARNERYDDARRLREACDDLLAIQRSYDALASAHALSFAQLWPYTNGAQRLLVRLNLVWRGVLQNPVSLTSDTAREEIDRALRPLQDSASVHSPADGPGLVAVPRQQLDPLLAVSRWFNENDRDSAVVIACRGEEQTDLSTVKSRLLARAQSLFKTGTSAAGEVGLLI
jgi:DNA polymerase-3 subunit epsilon